MNKNETLYIAEMNFGLFNPSMKPSLVTFATNENWTLVASSACSKDCSCTDACYEEDRTNVFKISNLTQNIQITDNKLVYQGYDVRDSVVLLDRYGDGHAKVEDFRFFSVHKSDHENALTDEGFDGYVGLMPDINTEDGLHFTENQGFVMALYSQKLIPAPIAAINISPDNVKYQSTLTLGVFNDTGIVKRYDVFNKSLPLIQKYYYDEDTFIYKACIKLKGYRWSILFEPDTLYLNRYAFFEMDMDYISVPIPVFDKNIKTTFL